MFPPGGGGADVASGNIVSTLDIFLEEYDRVSAFRGRKAIGQSEKKTSFLDANKPQAIKTIA